MWMCGCGCVNVDVGKQVCAVCGCVNVDVGKQVRAVCRVDVQFALE